MMSTSVTLRFSLAEPGVVLFLQREPDLCHDSVHFGVRKGAFRASESQGKRDALLTLGDLRASIFVERTDVLEEIAGRFLDGGVNGSRRDGLIDNHSEVTVDAGKSRERPGPRWMRKSEQRLDIDLEGDEAAIELGSRGHGGMQLAEVPELAAIDHHGR